MSGASMSGASMSGRSWRAVPQFVLWAMVGAGAVASLLTVLTIGIFLLPVTALLAGLLAWRGNRRLAGPGILAGLGLIPLYVGYLNRGGPGMVCTGTAVAGSCTQEWSPWPWVAAGVALAGAGAIGSVVVSRKSNAPERAGPAG
jgi:hypothetical protein